MRTGAALFDWHDEADLRILVGDTKGGSGGGRAAGTNDDDEFRPVVRIITDTQLAPSGSVMAQASRSCGCDV